MKGLFFKLSFILLLGCQITYGQLGNNWISLDGKVINEALENPIKAKLTLESLPYGGDIRVFYSESETGDFSFKVKENNEYKVTVESNGYITVTEEIQITDDMEKLLFSLMPSGSGATLRLDINFASKVSRNSKRFIWRIGRLLQID